MKKICLVIIGMLSYSSYAVCPSMTETQGINALISLEESPLCDITVDSERDIIMNTKIQPDEEIKSASLNLKYAAINQELIILENYYTPNFTTALYLDGISQAYNILSNVSIKAKPSNFSYYGPGHIASKGTLPLINELDESNSFSSVRQVHFNTYCIVSLYRSDNNSYSDFLLRKDYPYSTYQYIDDETDCYKYAQDIYRTKDVVKFYKQGVPNTYYNVE